ncbi:MAG: hypothetical protein FWF24_06520 [Alphaproteobacteria bacterium]|nr:hypothetical protein [Alphaproteobacteria bacterium]
MVRKIVVASLMAVILAGAAPVLAAPLGKINTRSNVNQPTFEALGARENVAQSAAIQETMNVTPGAAPVALTPPAPTMGIADVFPTAPPVMPASGQIDTLANFGPSSGTVVGNRALELRDEILRLRSSVNLNAGEFAILRSNGAAGAVQYHSTVAAITARLQNGTTRGNPILLRQWEEAEASLNEVTNSLNRLNSLQTSVAADSSLGSYMLESIQAAFLLSGAVDEDHDQLRLLRDEVSRLVVQLDFLRNQVADDIQRQTTYLTTERSNLQALAFAVTRGELLGNSVANRPVIVNPAPAPIMTLPQQSSFMPPPAAAPAVPVTPSPLMQGAEAVPFDSGGLRVITSQMGNAPSMGRLLVLIRFNNPNVAYEKSLSSAVATALQRKPDAEFSVVAVTPASGDPSELAMQQEIASRRAEGVRRSMIQLGLSPSKITVGSTQTAAARSAEVHVYVR